MVRREVVELIDDLDGKVLDGGGQTVQFTYQGVQYELDFSARHAQKLDAVLAPYLAVARRTGGRRKRSPAGPVSSPPRPAANKAQRAQMRSWARDNGYQVSDRGRVSREVQDAYHQATLTTRRPRTTGSHRTSAGQQ